VALTLTLALLALPSCGGDVAIDAPVLPKVGGGVPNTTSATGIAFHPGTPQSLPTCDPSYTCGKAIAPAGDPAKLCHSKKTAQFYAGLVSCACSPARPCHAVCAQTACINHPASAPCTACIEDMTIKNNKEQGCGWELHACTGEW
jgi:hypothetical protein